MRTFIIKSLKTFIVLCLLMAAAGAKAQNETVSFSSTELSAGKMMAEIEGQTRYKFGFEKALFDTTRMLKIDRLTTTVDSALEQLTAPANASYMIRGSVIILSPKAPERTAATERQSPRTSDRYRPADQHDLTNAWAERPAAEPVQEAEPVIIPEPEIKREYPAPYSAYEYPDLYRNIQTALPRYAIKANVLQTALTLAPTLSGEFAMGPRTTLEASVAFNRWNYEGSYADNKKQIHLIIQPEFRWWTCERFSGHFFGAHAIFAAYNVGQTDVPMLFKKEYHYEGYAYGAGVGYGYHLPLARRWGVEFNAGVGAAYMTYDKYKCGKCGEPIEKTDKWYFGPTRLGVSLVFMFK